MLINVFRNLLIEGLMPPEPAPMGGWVNGLGYKARIAMLIIAPKIRMFFKRPVRQSRNPMVLLAGELTYRPYGRTRNTRPDRERSAKDRLRHCLELTPEALRAPSRDATGHRLLDERVDCGILDGSAPPNETISCLGNPEKQSRIELPERAECSVGPTSSRPYEWSHLGAIFFPRSKRCLVGVRKIVFHTSPDARKGARLRLLD